MVQAVKAGDKKKETIGADIKKTGQPDYKLLIDTAALAGTIMLENGAEIYRVEETINYILKTSGLKTSEAFVVSTGIMISLDDPSIDALTVIRRVNKGATNLNVIAQVNDISRKFYMRIISLEEAFSQLKHLKKSQYPWWLKDICTVFVVAFFVLEEPELLEALLPDELFDEELLLKLLDEFDLLLPDLLFLNT